MPGNKPCLPGCECEKHSPERRERLRQSAVAQAEREGHEQRSAQVRGVWAAMQPDAREARVERVADSLRGRTWTPEAVEARRQGMLRHYALLSDEQKRARTAAAVASRSGRRISAAEIEVGAALAFMGIAHEAQAPLGRYLVDFLIPEFNLIVEVDGAYWHDADKDRERDAWLVAQGYAVQRIAEREAKRNAVHAVARAVLAFGHARGV